jgi:hypothetical protein
MKFLVTAGRWGGILLLIALLIALVKQLISLIGLVGMAIKLLIVVAFVALFVFVGYLIFKGLSEKKSRID